MTILALDVETTTFQKGNPFARRNNLVYAGINIEGRDIQLGTTDVLSYIGPEVVRASLVVGCNIKFDLHWLRRYGYTLGDNGRVWDVQLAHFLLTSQRNPYPSLNDCCAYYGLPRKDSRISDYWKRGIDTPDIPQEEMIDYLRNDLILTWEVYERQRKEFTHRWNREQLFNLFKLQCLDLLCLEEMEANGLLYDTLSSQEKSEVLWKEMAEINKELNSHDPYSLINWNSGDHLSVFLFGGILSNPIKKLVGIYKSGLKAGEPRYKNDVVKFEYEGYTKPLKGTELKKEGFYSTDENHLRQLKTPKHILELLLRRSQITKLLDSYQGLPTLIEEKDWEDNILHGNFNQCVARTGRLTSSSPNEQNFPEEVNQLIVSKYV